MMSSATGVPEDVKLWISNDFSAICQRSLKDVDLDHALWKENRHVWSYVVRHVKPRSQVLKIRRHLEIYRSLSDKNVEDSASTRSNLLYQLATLNMKKKCLAEQVTELEKDLKDFHDAKISRESPLNYAHLPQTVASHYTKDAVSEIENRVHLMSDSIQNLKRLDFQKLCKRIQYNEQQMEACVGLRSQLDISSFVHGKTPEEIFQYQLNSYAEAWEKTLPDVGGLENFQDSLDQVKRMQTLHVKKFFKKEKVLKRKSELAENSEFQDSNGKVHLFELSRAEQFYTVLEKQNDALNRLLANMIPTSPTKLDILVQGNELHNSCVRLWETAVKLLSENGIIVKDLSYKQRKMKLNSLHNVEQEIARINKSKAGFVDLQNLILHPSLMETSVGEKQSSTCRELVPSFREPSFLINSMIHLEVDLHALKKFIFCLKQLCCELKNVDEIISKVPTSHSFKDQQFVSMIGTLLSEAVRCLKEAGDCLKAVDAAALEWWEQPASIHILGQEKDDMKM